MNQKILLVDDEPAALNCYRQMLESEFDIATAARGEEGLVSLRNHGPFAVVISDMQIARIVAQPAQNPSFWTKKSEIHHEYKKVQGFWLPIRNESVSYIRMGGRTTLTIEYKDYRVTDARQALPVLSSGDSNP